MNEIQSKAKVPIEIDFNQGYDQRRTRTDR